MVFKVVVVGKGMKGKRGQKWAWCLVVFVVLLIVGFYLKTGISQLSKIDERDLERWDYSDEGIIIGAEEFELEGAKGTCWLMIHGYSSSPKDFRVLSERVNEEFGDYVIVPRLEGHGEVPSKVLDLSLDEWYVQVEKEFDKLDKECGEVNLAGFSFGGALASKLAEEKKVGRIYLISPFVFAGRKLLFVPIDWFLKGFSDIVIYSKKLRSGQINNVESGKDYIAYYNFPLIPIKNSYGFIDAFVEDLREIEGPILIQHSRGDDAANFRSSEIIFEGVGSKDKEFEIFKRSNHVLFFDYDREEVISNVIDFERNYRR